MSRGIAERKISNGNQIALAESDPSNDTKRQRILEGAMKVFLAYGFSRVTMDDIARAADMSRPALYLQFRNKTDIFRAIAAMLLDKSADDAETALAGSSNLAERLMRMIDVCLIAMMQMIAESPHGAEILDMKGTLSGDLAATWRGRLSCHVEAALAGEAAKNGVDLAQRGLSAKALADMLLDGLEGMKMRVSDPGDQRRAARALVSVVDIVLKA